MCTFGVFDLLKSITRTRSQVRLHQFHCLVLCDSPVGHKHVANGEMHQTDHIIKCDCHLPKRKVEAGSLLVPPLHKGTNQTMVNQAVAGILKPTKASALQSIMPPLCSHDRDGFFIMHQFYLLSVVDAF